MRRSHAFSHTTAIAIPGCIFNVNENGSRTARERGVIERSSRRNALNTGVAFYLDLIGQLGGCNPGDASHSLICEPVSACRAFRISSSRAAPGGSCKASSRRRFASWVSRTSREVDWMTLLRRAMLSFPNRCTDAKRTNKVPVPSTVAVEPPHSCLVWSAPGRTDRALNHKGMTLGTSELHIC